jgi:hypothetical protein
MSDVDNEKLAEVARRLGELTKAGKIRWETTDQLDTFLFGAPSSNVLVGSLNGDGEHPFFMRVMTPAGEVTDSLETFSDVTDVWGRPEWHLSIRDLHRRARRDATKADAVVDSLIEELKGLESPPF